MQRQAELRAALAALALLLALPLGAQVPAARASLAAAPAAAPAAPAATPQPALAAGDVYRREVFRYQRGGRPDPYQPLLTAAELGFRVEDLRLTAVIFSSDARRSVAVFAEGDSARRYRLHQGQRLGTMTVLRIFPQRVDVRVDEFGGTRLQSIPLVRTQRIEQAASAAQGQAPAPGTQQIPINITTAPAQAPTGPRVLRRGAPPAATTPAAPAARPPTYNNPRQPR